METLANYQLAIELASAILIKRGEVSFNEIKALPFIFSENDASIVFDAIRQAYDVSLITKKTASLPYMQWDSIIRLNSIPSAVQHTVFC